MATLIKKDGTQITVLKSNKDSKKYINPVFNFDLLNSTHKEAVSEVISLLEKRKDVPQHIVIEELKQSFQLEDIPEMDVKSTLWHQFTKDEPIGANIQGYRIEKDADGKKRKIPHIAFSSDLDVLEEMMKRIITTVRNSVNTNEK
jgi:hypothetical protein